MDMFLYKRYFILLKWDWKIIIRVLSLAFFEVIWVVEKYFYYFSINCKEICMYNFSI